MKNSNVISIIVIIVVCNFFLDYNYQ